MITVETALWLFAILLGIRWGWMLREWKYNSDNPTD